MARSNITSQMLTDHVKRIGDEHPAIPMDSVDFTVKNPEPVSYTHLDVYKRQVRAVVSLVLVGVLVTLTAYLYPLHYDDLLAGARRPTEVLAVRNVGLLVFMVWSGAAAWAAARSDRGSRGPAATGRPRPA